MNLFFLKEFNGDSACPKRWINVFFFIGCFKIKNKFIKIVMVFLNYFPGKMSQKKDSRLVKTSASIWVL